MDPSANEDNKNNAWKRALGSLPASMRPSSPERREHHRPRKTVHSNSVRIGSPGTILPSIGTGPGNPDERGEMKLPDKTSIYASNTFGTRYPSEPFSSIARSPVASALEPRRYSSADTSFEPVPAVRRRQRTSTGSEFTLINLARSIKVQDLNKALETRGVPADAISEIRIRHNTFSTTATIRVADGYTALDVERRLRGLPPISLTAPSSTAGQPAATGTRVPRTSEVVDLTAEGSSAEPRLPVTAGDSLRVEGPDSDMSLDCTDDSDPVVDSGLHVPPVDNTPAAQLDPISPALSYLTIDDTWENEVLEDDFGAPPLERVSIVNIDPMENDGGEVESSSSTNTDDEDYPFVAPPASAEDSTHLHHAPIAQGKRRVRSPRRVYKQPEGKEPEVLSDNVDAQSPRNRFREDDSAESNSDSSASSNDYSTHVDDAQAGGPRRSATNSRPSFGSSKPAATRLVKPIADYKSVTVDLPKVNLVRARRLLVSDDTALPIVAVGMRGDFQFIDQTKRSRIASFSLPAEKWQLGEVSGVNRRVLDALLLNDSTVVVGYEQGPAQVACVQVVLDGAPRPYRVDIGHRGHTADIPGKNGEPPTPNPGISSMVAMPHDRSRCFLTGGRDGDVRMWTLDGQGRGLEATSVPLALSPKVSVGCLGYRKTDHCVFVCHQRHIYSARVEATKASELSLLSAVPRQVHVHPQNPNVVILEVDHLDYQMQVYDLRHRKFNSRAVMEFGYRDTTSKIPTSRHQKGSTTHALFARGFKDGTTCLWDYRNCENVVSKTRVREDPIVHAVLRTNQLLAYGAHRVTFWNTDEF